MQPISFIHTADLHLDSPFKGTHNLPQMLQSRLYESTFTAFSTIVRTAIEEAVDFVLISGDLYDGEDRSIKAQIRFRNECVALHEHNIQVIALHGNHDHLNGQWTNIALPSNVHIFSEDVSHIQLHSKLGVPVYFYGFSYASRHVYEKKIEAYHKIHDPNAYHIGLIHGQLEGNVNAHAPYAPFSLGDLLAKDMHYWALGHIHLRQIIHSSPPVVYPGNIQGRHKNEKGEKGCYLVKMSKDGDDLTFIPTSTILWDEITIDLSSLNQVVDIYSYCQKILDQHREQGKGKLIVLQFLQNEALQTQTVTLPQLDEIVEVLQDTEKEEDNFVWIIDYQLDVRKSIHLLKKENKDLSEAISSAILTLQESEHFHAALAELYNHTHASRYLEVLDETQDLIQDAEQKLLYLLSSLS